LAESRAICTDLLARFDQTEVRIGLVAGLLMTRAELFAAEGRPEEAMTDAERALAVARQMQGDEPHSLIAGQAWLGLAELHQAAGKRTAARQAIKQAVGQIRATVTPDHPLLLKALGYADQIG
jgi:tetratricopeptide (TPR) repeat protein